MLTTRCPHCNTVFRVRPEQLSVRGGRVRCGHCQQAFSALSHLEEMDEDDIALASRPAASPQAVASTPVIPVPTPTRASAPQGVPAPAYPPKEPTIILPATRPVVPPAVPVSHQAHSPWGALEGDKARAFPALEPVVAKPAAEVLEHAPLFKTERLRPAADVEPELVAPVFIGIPEAPALAAFTARAAEFEAPAVGDAFSMNIVLEGNQLPANTPADEDMDFDFSGLGQDAVVEAPSSPEPRQSALGKAMGVPAYDPTQDQIFDQTVMLEEPIDLMGLPHADNGPESLFFERERQQTTPRTRVEDRHQTHAAWPWALGVLALLLLAALQLSFVFRVELARALPLLRPNLELACARLGCSVPYPQDAEQIALEGHSFNPEVGAEGKFRLVVTLLNKAPHQQAWPHLELTVTDRFDIAVARRVFAPADWLPAANAGQPAFDGHSEITANLPLAISNLQAAGYRLYVFYP